jgi:hypothetical protein
MPPIAARAAHPMNDVSLLVALRPWLTILLLNTAA